MPGKRKPVHIDPPLGQLLNLTQAAKYLGMRPRRLRVAISHRRIQYIREGHEFGIYTAWCDDFVRRHSMPVSADPPKRPTLQDLLPKPGEELFLRVRH